MIFTASPRRHKLIAMDKKSSMLLGSNLQGQLLIAMPDMTDARFHRSIVQLCAHSAEGAMGLIVNKRIDDLDLESLIDQIDLTDSLRDGDVSAESLRRPVHNGGPVEANRGFVLHSPDYFSKETTLKVTDSICLTATTDILAAVATGEGPHHALVALGYAGWSPGQLEGELAANAWLNCPTDPDIVFAIDDEAKYEKALSKLGIDPSHLVSAAGRA
jgi:putative transcriptional regulator